MILEKGVCTTDTIVTMPYSVHTPIILFDNSGIPRRGILITWTGDPQPNLRKPACEYSLRTRDQRVRHHASRSMRVHR